MTKTENPGFNLNEAHFVKQILQTSALKSHERRMNENKRLNPALFKLYAGNGGVYGYETKDEPIGKLLFFFLILPLSKLGFTALCAAVKVSPLYRRPLTKHCWFSFTVGL